MRTRKTPLLPSLSARLQCVMDAVDQAERVFDVGCDHALVAISLVMQARCQYVYAMDHRAGPLAVATERIARYGVAGRVMPILADGLGEMRPTGRDAIVIAGLGGNETIRILQRAQPLASGTVCVLQPMKSAFELRTYLSSSGFEFEAERICRERGHIYCVMRVRYTGRPPLRLALEAAYAGPCVLACWDAGARSEPLRAHLRAVTMRLRKAARGDPALWPAANRLAARLRAAEA